MDIAAPWREINELALLLLDVGTVILIGGALLLILAIYYVHHHGQASANLKATAQEIGGSMKQRWQEAVKEVEDEEAATGQTPNVARPKPTNWREWAENISDIFKRMEESNRRFDEQQAAKQAANPNT